MKEILRLFLFRNIVMIAHVSVKSEIVICNKYIKSYGYKRYLLE